VKNFVPGSGDTTEKPAQNFISTDKKKATGGNAFDLAASNAKKKR
jgi:hypothetical protein